MKLHGRPDLSPPPGSRPLSKNAKLWPWDAGEQSNRQPNAEVDSAKGEKESRRQRSSRSTLAGSMKGCSARTNYPPTGQRRRTLLQCRNEPAPPQPRLTPNPKSPAENRGSFGGAEGWENRTAAKISRSSGNAIRSGMGLRFTPRRQAKKKWDSICEKIQGFAGTSRTFNEWRHWTSGEKPLPALCPLTSEAQPAPSVSMSLAQFIREIDGAHQLGAGELRAHRRMARSTGGQAMTVQMGCRFGRFMGFLAGFALCLWLVQRNDRIRTEQKRRPSHDPRRHHPHGARGRHERQAKKTAIGNGL